MSTQVIWQDLDQASLDRAYDQSCWATNMAQVQARYISSSEQLRQRWGAPQRLAYGSAALESLDLHRGRPGSGLAPALLYVHGGAWRSGRAQDYAFIAEPYLQAGASVLIPDFDAVQDCGGDIGVLAAQVLRCLRWVLAHAKDLGIDAARLHLCGHSSGAHLAALVATRLAEDDAGQIASLLCCSGMYELEPVRLSSRRHYLSLDAAAVQALSPARHVQSLRCPVLVVAGSQESPQFLWQSRMWAESVIGAGLGTSAVLVDGCNHFEVIETLAQPRLARLQLHRMGLCLSP